MFNTLFCRTLQLILRVLYLKLFLRRKEAIFKKYNTVRCIIYEREK
jgi:hypothetical protein